MALELIVNLLLIAGGIFCFVNVSTTMPHSAVNELGAEQWPQAILVLMLIALAFNVIRFFKINKKEDIEAAFKDFFPAIGRFVKSKLFLGMVLVVVMALMYEPVGFMLTCLLFLFAYGLLLGQRNIPHADPLFRHHHHHPVHRLRRVSGRSAPSRTDSSPAQLRPVR